MDWYQGILLVEPKMVAELSGGDGAVPVTAELAGDAIVVIQSGGAERRIAWRAIRDRANLHHLPPPSAAFVSDDGVLGLLFKSATPRPGLQYVEPHSVVFTLGHLRL
jgi:hypothetical protein